MFKLFKSFMTSKLKSTCFEPEEIIDNQDETDDTKETFYFSIVTESGRYILCKVWDWSTVDKVYWQNNFLKQLSIVDSYDGIFEVHSEQPIPDDWKKWFSENRIAFQEG